MTSQKTTAANSQSPFVEPPTDEFITEARELALRYRDTMGLTRDGAIRRIHVLTGTIAKAVEILATSTTGWTCFHCGDHFTASAAARLHFGHDETAPACKIKGAEGSLLKALRDAEQQADEHLQMMHDESTEAAKAYHALRCRSEQSIRAAEELGYARGLADGRALGWRPIDDDTPRDGWDSPIMTCRMGGPDPRLGGRLLSGYAEPPEAAYWNDAGDCWTPVQRPHDPWDPTHWMPMPPAFAQESTAHG